MTPNSTDFKVADIFPELVIWSKGYPSVETRIFGGMLLKPWIFQLKETCSTSEVSFEFLDRNQLSGKNPLY